MKYFIIAGEASGDLHASNLLKELKLLDQKANVDAWGGDLLKAQGANILKHIKELAFMGFKEVIQNLPTILSNIKLCKDQIIAFNPDVIILVDYPGFNLRIAKWAKENGFKIVYYISPQLWAWKENRVKQVKAYVDLMLVILPFEKDFYKKHNYNVEYVGHPLLDVIQDKGMFETSNSNNIALLPGSRKQEIKEMLPIMLKAAKTLPNYNFIIGIAPSIDKEFYYDLINNTKNIHLSNEGTYNILNKVRAAAVTSGTATLETALHQVPEVVCYKGGKISFMIAKTLIKVKYISLVNLIADKLIVKELIQEDLSAKSLSLELMRLLQTGTYRDEMIHNYIELKELLGNKGASLRAAEKIIAFLKPK